MAKIAKRFILDSLELILIAVAIFAIVNIFLGELLLVTGSSMAPALKNNEQIIGEKISLNFSPLKRGEIIIFKHPNKNILIIKRIVGMPGETVKIEKGSIYINDKLLNEPYTKGRPTKGGESVKEGVEYKIPDNHYLLLGDNRTESMDSREWGFLNKKGITSRALLVYYPLENFRLIRN